jgi:hypothetical protein
MLQPGAPHERSRTSIPVHERDAGEPSIGVKGHLSQQ